MTLTYVRCMQSTVANLDVIWLYEKWTEAELRCMLPVDGAVCIIGQLAERRRPEIPSESGYKGGNLRSPIFPAS